MSDKRHEVAKNIARAQDAIQAAEVAIGVVTGKLAEVLEARFQMQMRIRALRAARWCRWIVPDQEQLDDWSVTLVAKRQALQEEYERLKRDGDQSAAADFRLRLRAHASEVEDFEAVVEFALLARLDRN